MIDKIETVLNDIEFFSGARGVEVIAQLDEDMMDFEILYTLEELKTKIVTKLVEEGRTYEMPDGNRHTRAQSSGEGYFG